ncbi:MAG: PorT family protein [Gemmatimonadetes bacterium]|nr:PorT family protein [Gemmatimonadota bacterium]
MNRWLVSTAMMAVLAVPITAGAQVTRDTMYSQARDTACTCQNNPAYSTGRDTVSATFSAEQNRDTTYITRQRRDTMYMEQRDTMYVAQPRRDTTYIAQTTTYREKQETDHEYQEQAGFMVKGGLSFGNVSNRGVLPGTLKSRNGWAAGMGFHGASPVGFGIEALWVQRGVNNAGLPSGDLNARELDYIDVPAYLRLSVPFNFQPFVYAGPQASFEVRCRAGSAGCPDTGRPTTSWNAIIGAGLRFAEGVALSLEARYVYGLTDLKLNTVTTSSSYRTRSFMLLAGIGI